MENLRGKKIFVGLSGGVDSAVTAALLQKAGANVVGVFIKGWYPPGMPCTWADDRRDAMRVAAHLRIPFHTLDASAEYKKGVIDYLLSEYAEGRTPNPDIMCNREVKFGAFYTFAKEHGADFIATGHYARVTHVDSHDTEMIGETIETKLLRGVDASKDQSYFLWAVPKEALAHTLFPLGKFEKSKVREMAKKFALPVAEKRDSQGICFLGSISVDEFLREELHPEQGKILNIEGKEIGVHDGAVLYTLGSRIAVAVTKESEAGPWYVVAKDMRANTVIVSKELQTVSSEKEVALRETNWFRSAEGEIEAQYRYHGPLVQGKIRVGNSEKTATFIPTSVFAEPIASGQSLVLYRGDECLGGGIIV